MSIAGPTDGTARFRDVPANEPDFASRPATQLPRGPYPASTRTIWSIAVLTVAVGALLGAAIPAILSATAGDAPGIDPARIVVLPDTGP